MGVTYRLGEGVDHIRASAKTGELLIRLGEDGCHIVLRLTDVRGVLFINDKEWLKHQLSAVERQEQRCPATAHTHYREHLSFLGTNGPSWRPSLYLSVNGFDIVHVPFSLVFELYQQAWEWKDEKGWADLNSDALKDWETR